MATVINPGWRSAVSRVLKRLDERRAANQPLPPPARVQPVEPPAPERIELPPLDFHTGEPVTTPPPVPAPVARPVLKSVEKPRVVEKVAVLEDPVRQRVRDAYVGARFAGFARNSHDLARVRAVVKAAELYFEDGNPLRAAELLDLAIELQPSAEPLWRARLDIALRAQDRAAYHRTAMRFHEAHPHAARGEEGRGFASWELAPEFMPADLRLRVLAAGRAEERQENRKEAA